MGHLPGSATETRLAATLFLLLLGVADIFGAWQVRNFAAFTPKATAATVAPESHTEMTMACCQTSAAEEKTIDLAMLNHPRHQIGRELLVQDTHVHVPVYAMTALLLSAIVLGLSLSSRVRIVLVLGVFAAPFLDFAGLWGAHLKPEAGAFFGGVAVAGGFAMGLVYLVVLALTLGQCWFFRKRGGNDHA
ncbi:MAG TPA: hypothetical protein VFL12_12505 [Thermoanaerobaculia bacterium]|nr:hypothetical protein [Thermoanaerobaculia bacterium]